MASTLIWSIVLLCAAATYARRIEESFLYHGKIVKAFRDIKDEDKRSAPGDRSKAFAGKKRSPCGGCMEMPEAACMATPSCASTPGCCGGGEAPMAAPGAAPAMAAPMGAPGAPGPMGFPGAPGPIGPMGPAGGMGMMGPMGPMGFNGSPGYPGSPGAPGASCPPMCLHFAAMIRPLPQAPGPAMGMQPSMMGGCPAQCPAYCCGPSPGAYMPPPPPPPMMFMPMPMPPSPPPAMMGCAPSCAPSCCGK